MYLVIVDLVPAAAIADRNVDAHVLVDVLWAVAGPGFRVEHIAARAGPGNLHVGLYLRADSQADADRWAHELLDRVVSTAPLLRGWSVRRP